MEWLWGVLFFVVLGGIVMFVSTVYLRHSSGRRHKSASSLTLLLTTAAVICLPGCHRCSEGGVPSPVIFFFAIISALLPWLLCHRLWILRGVIVLVVSVGVVFAGYLAWSYHSDDITGNPNYSSDRFWHTWFTGQYPRDRAKTPRFQTEDLAE